MSSASRSSIGKRPRPTTPKARTAWWRPGEQPIPAGDPRNILGARWLGFRETQDLAGFGIHGTEDPSSLGKESSAGCIRLRNEDIEVLFDFAPYGTEVVVRG